MKTTLIVERRTVPSAKWLALALATGLILISTALFAQRHTPLEYYALINEAELKITNRDFSGALEIYEDAMHGYGKPFSKDLYNAALCAQYSGDLKKANHYVRDLIVLGFDLEDFEHNDAWRSFVSSKYWQKILKRHSKLNRMHFNLMNLEYLSEIRMLEDYAHQFRYHPDPSKSFEDTIREIDERNIDRLSKLIRNYGFPAEQLIGVRSFQYQPYFVVLFHEYRRDQSRTPDLNTRLKTAVKKGELSPHMYAYLADQNKQTSAYGSDLLNPELGLVSKHFLAADMDSYNKQRKLIGLGTIREEKRKLAFSHAGLGFYFERYEEPDMPNYKGYKEFKIYTFNGQKEPVKLGIPW
jgi:hypothetical protein